MIVGCYLIVYLIACALINTFILFVVVSKNKDVCHKNPCLHRGRCFVDDNYIDGYFCKCQKNYKGVRCQRKLCMAVVKISQLSLTTHK